MPSAFFQLVRISPSLAAIFFFYFGRMTEKGFAMARKENGDTETAEDIEEEQAEMFPELDVSKPGQKELLSAAKRYHKANSERSNLLKTSKAKCDGLMTKVIDLMKEHKIEKFQYKGCQAELIHGSDKVEVEMTSDDEPAE